MRNNLDFSKNENYTKFIKSHFLRKRRARKNITLTTASKEIGISNKTLGRIENEKLLRVRKTVYKKLVDWLVNEKIYKEV